ncbi:MAG TPA: endonuclease/exonuclease/phosphatase family protein [Vicinamibacterales bacterium]|nr:endonuclease/exonuclease/phosphatase family protein [Vicinamibacterales bacterium]
MSSLRERSSLDRWCAGVGLPARIEGTRAAATFSGPLAVVSWNTHVGAGNIDAFVADLRSGRLTGRPVTDFVLLLQEAYRTGFDVPSRNGVSWASAGQARALKDSRVEAVRAAERLGLWGVYVPSMRNGQPVATAEDRGNAILSTRPLSDITAIELPLERQRRVAIAATVMLGPGRPLHVVCTHFTNMVMHHLWLLSESGRLRQARALAQALPADGPLILGGDFNAWFGFHDAAYRQLAEVLSHPAVEDRRPTFGPLRLDHLLFRLPGWRAELRRADSKYGSDHYPLIASIDVP